MVQKASTAAQVPDARTLRRKRDILEAASRVFRRQGLHASGMRDIAAELDMHVGNLYYYFRNKDELLAFCQEDALAGLLDLAGQVRATGLRADAKLYRLIVGHVIRVNEETPGALAHLEVDALTGDRRQRVLRQRDAYETAYREIISDGIDQRVFRPVDAAVAAMAILGALNWTVKWYRQDGRRSSQEIGREFADLLVRGLLASGVELSTDLEETAISSPAGSASRSEDLSEGKEEDG